MYYTALCFPQVVVPNIMQPFFNVLELLFTCNYLFNRCLLSNCYWLDSPHHRECSGKQYIDPTIQELLGGGAGREISRQLP